MDFKQIRPGEIKDNAFSMISTVWMLITAGIPGNYNTMTASWGGFGHLWHKDVCFIFIRPQRYTYRFIENNSVFTLSFFNEQYRDALKLCGTKSGKDIDKVAEAGLTPVKSPQGSIYFNEARLVIECRKIYFHDINPQFFLDQNIASNYTNRDYHRMYTGEILTVLAR